MNKFVLLAAAWGILSLILGMFESQKPYDWAMLFSVAGSGLYTTVLWFTKSYWLPLTKNFPVRFAIIVGVINAFVVELIFWSISRFLGVSGIAADDNLFINMIVTMPWYVGLVIFFALSQKHALFRTSTALLLGAVYQLFADGVLGGQVIPSLFGQPVNFVQTWILLSLFGFWMFIPVYSSIIAIPAYIIRFYCRNDVGTEVSRFKLLLYGLKPLIWLGPFGVYVVLLILLSS